MKTDHLCRKCHEIKPVDCFHKQPRGKYGIKNYCKDCARKIQRQLYLRDPKKHCEMNMVWQRKNPERVKTNSIKWSKNNPEKIKIIKRKCFLKKKYNMTESDYNLMLIKQNGLCAICKAPTESKLLHVDHSHSTGLVRGLLCHPCNSGIGLFRENRSTFISAIEYLGLNPIVENIYNETTAS